MRIALVALPGSFLFLAACSSGGNTNPDTCTNISGEVVADGLSIRKPEEDVTACHEIVNPSSSGRPMVCQEVAPDLGCVGQNEPLGTPRTVTYTGCVSSFGLGAPSDKLTVTVMTEMYGDGMRTDPGYDLDGAPGMQTENTPAAFIEKTISTTVDRSQCADGGEFRLEGVPTETPLIVRVTDQQLAKDLRNYIDTYQYNVLLRNSAIRSGPEADAPPVADPAACTPAMCFVVDEVNSVFLTTFRAVALTAGVSYIPGEEDLYDGSGEGHLAGEVQDCSSTDRLKNAVVALDAQVRKLAYFNVDFPPDNDDIEDPKVEGSRTRTNADGLYAAIGVSVPSGGKAVKIGTAVTETVCGEDGVCRCVDGAANPSYTAADTGEGEAQALAARTVFVYPDSITIMTFDRNLYTKP